MNHPNGCDCCGTKNWGELNQMCHIPGIMRNGQLDVQWWCDKCAEGWLECPAEFVQPDGSCEVCG